MKPNIYARLLRVTAIGALSITTQVAIAEEHADKIIVSQNVLTMATSKPEQARPLAIAITGERISWVGAPEDMQAWTGPDTEVTDYGDQAVLPGFIDAHGHISFSALATTLANVASPPVGPVVTIADLQQTLRDYIEERGIATGEWVVGMGYDDSLITENRHPDRDDLDRILAQLERPTIDITPGFELEPQEASLVLTNARFEGRVFDETGARLPSEGLGISGELPLNVKVVRTGELERPVDVRFEVPRRFFDGIDWSYAGIT